MKSLVICLFGISAILFVIGVWTQVTGRSDDERGGAYLSYGIAAVLFGIDVCLLATWGFVRIAF